MDTVCSNDLPSLSRETRGIDVEMRESLPPVDLPTPNILPSDSGVPTDNPVDVEMPESLPPVELPTPDILPVNSGVPTDDAPVTNSDVSTNLLVRRGRRKIPPHEITGCRPSLALRDVTGHRSQYYLCGYVYENENAECIETMVLPPLSIKCKHCGALFRSSELQKP